MSAPEPETFPAGTVPFAEHEIFKSHPGYHGHGHGTGDITKTVYTIKNMANFKYATGFPPGVLPPPVTTEEPKKDFHGRIEASQTWIITLVDITKNIFTIQNAERGEPYAYCDPVQYNQPVVLGQNRFPWNIYVLPNGNSVITPAEYGRNSWFWGITTTDPIVALKYNSALLSNQWKFEQA